MTGNLSLIASRFGNSALNTDLSPKQSYMYASPRPLHVLSSTELDSSWELGHISSQNP